ncbi:DNA-3-methyladenine glycosylase [Compostibacter hankyongensis]|uniref:Putative 3-methyladenine DNA glycosylase n=1 Tax=Compostibacter hankyongensis TaxID=1007089 RepID=A0ABP8FI47_9BACT
MTRLPESFYTRGDVVKISRELLGKVLISNFDGNYTAGRIVETEAYAGITDRASHAWGGRRTQRTEVMYNKGGLAYVYLCYGIHHLFNVVVNEADIPHAVLVRAVEPVAGIEYMLERRGKAKPAYTLTAGPGALTQALGIRTEHTGYNLITDERLWIGDDGQRVSPRQIVKATRVGVDYAREDAYRLYRFYLRDNPWVSKGKGLVVPG